MSTVCFLCSENVYEAERKVYDGKTFHRLCFIKWKKHYLDKEIADARNAEYYKIPDVSTTKIRESNYNTVIYATQYLPQGTQPNSTYLDEISGNEQVQPSSSPAATAVQTTPRGTPLFSYPVAASCTVPALPVSSSIIHRPVSPASTISNVPLFYHPAPQQTTQTSPQTNGPANIPLFYYPTPQQTSQRSGASTPEDRSRSPSPSPSSTPRTWRPRSQSMNSNSNAPQNNSNTTEHATLAAIPQESHGIKVSPRVPLRNSLPASLSPPTTARPFHKRYPSAEGPSINTAAQKLPPIQETSNSDSPSSPLGRRNKPRCASLPVQRARASATAASTSGAPFTARTSFASSTSPTGVSAAASSASSASSVSSATSNSLSTTSFTSNSVSSSASASASTTSSSTTPSTPITPTTPTSTAWRDYQYTFPQPKQKNRLSDPTHNLYTWKRTSPSTTHANHILNSKAQNRYSDDLTSQMHRYTATPAETYSSKTYPSNKTYEPTSEIHSEPEPCTSQHHAQSNHVQIAEQRTEIHTSATTSENPLPDSSIPHTSYPTELHTYDNSHQIFPHEESIQPSKSFGSSESPKSVTSPESFRSSKASDPFHFALSDSSDPSEISNESTAREHKTKKEAEEANKSEAKISEAGEEEELDEEALEFASRSLSEDQVSSLLAHVVHVIKPHDLPVSPSPSLAAPLEEEKEIKQEAPKPPPAPPRYSFLPMFSAQRMETLPNNSMPLSPRPLFSGNNFPRLSPRKENKHETIEAKSEEDVRARYAESTTNHNNVNGSLA